VDIHAVNVVQQDAFAFGGCERPVAELAVGYRDGGDCIGIGRFAPHPSPLPAGEREQGARVLSCECWLVGGAYLGVLPLAVLLRAVGNVPFEVPVEEVLVGTEKERAGAAGGVENFQLGRILWRQRRTLTPALSRSTGRGGRIKKLPNRL